MLAGPTLVLLLAATKPASAAPPAAAPPAARAELDACAERIEEMKARRERGAELDRLLRRAQELAAELERASGSLPLHPDGPSPEELRERADAARDEADRLAAEIAALDVRLQDARRSRGEPASGLQRAAMGTPAPAASEAPLRALQAKRTALAERRAQAEAEANQLEAEAHAAERVR
jgi:hypothetical protein